MATELDFADIKAQLRAFLEGQTAFRDYDFEGSNLSVLLDLLAYNTTNMALYWNLASAEYWLDSAQLRESVASHAKTLNYLPRSKSSALANVNVTIAPNDTPEKIIIPRQYRFVTTVDGLQLTFTTNNAVTITPSNGVYTANNVTLYEGNLVTEYFNVASVESGNLVSYTSHFTLNSENIDQSSIEVFVRENPDDVSYTQWGRHDTLYGVTNSTRAFFVQPARANQYEVVFGNGVIGMAPPNGASVRVIYRDTMGSRGNGVVVLNKTVPIDNYTAISVSANERSYGGAERESNIDVVRNAPRAYQTQGRAVTAYDYQSMILARFPQVRSCIAYGGERIKQYGKVVISLRAFGSESIVSDSLKAQVIAYLTGKNLTTQPIIIDADVFNVEVVTQLTIDRNIDSNFTNIESSIASLITAFNDDELAEFGSDLRYSQLVAAIDDSNRAIVSNETSLRMIKKFAPTVNVSQTFSINYGQKLRNYGANNNALAIESSYFTFLNTDDQDITAKVADDGNGTINLYQIVNDQPTLLMSNIGTVNYETGVVEFLLTIKGYTGSFKVYARIDGQDIFVSDNQYLEILAGDVTVTSVEA